MAVKAYALTTLAKIKLYLGIATATTTYDTLLENLIDSITDFIESYCGGRRFFDNGTGYTNVEYDGTPYNREKLFTWLTLPNFPINSVSSIQYSSGDFENPTWTSFDLDDYEIYANRGQIYFPAGLPVGMHNIRISYKAGFTTIPSDLELLTHRLVSKEYNRRKEVGIISESIGGSSVSWDDKITELEKNVLNKYAIPEV